MHSLEHGITAWDRAAFLAINHGLKCPLLDFLMPRISDLGLQILTRMDEEFKTKDILKDNLSEEEAAQLSNLLDKLRG